MRLNYLKGVLGVVLLTGSWAGAEEWPKWLGPRGDGISQEKGLAEKWPDGGPKKVWSAAVGMGYSSPIAVDGKVYLLSMVDNKDKLSCFDAATGKVVWEQVYPGAYTGQFPGTRATPTIENGKIYTYSGNGDLYCRNLADGKEVWNLSVQKETNAQNLIWGVASATLIVGDVIYVQNGRGADVPTVVAVDKNTGKIVWKSQFVGKAGKEPQGGGYAHVVQIDVGGTRQLVAFASDTLVGLNPKDGKTIWTLPWQTQYDVNAATPIYRDGNLFVTSDYGRGCMMVKVTATGATKAWENKEVMSRFQPVLLEGNVFYANSEGTLKCLSWPDGAVKWANKMAELRVGMGGSLVKVGDKLITLSESGKLSMSKATPEGISLISQTQLFDGKEIWATPLVYNGKLYAKGPSELVCVDISAKQ